LTFYVWGYCAANPHLSCGRFCPDGFRPGDCFTCWRRWKKPGLWQGRDAANVSKQRNCCGGERVGHSPPAS